MSRLWQTFKSLPLPQLVLLGVGILVVLALVSGGVGGCVSQMKDAKFDKVQAERESQIQTLTTERNEAIGRAQAWEQRAKELESKVAINEAIIAASGARAEAAQKAVEDEQEKLNQELADIGADIDPALRLERIKERLRRLAKK